MKQSSDMTDRELDEPVQWTGNPLTREGTIGRLGGVEAHLVHIDPQLLGLSKKTTTQLRRTWMLSIFDETGGLYIEGSCVAEMLLVNLMPESAKREAERIMRWATAWYRSIADEPGVGKVVEWAAALAAHQPQGSK